MMESQFQKLKGFIHLRLYVIGRHFEGSEHPLAEEIRRQLTEGTSVGDRHLRFGNGRRNFPSQPAQVPSRTNGEKVSDGANGKGLFVRPTKALKEFAPKPSVTSGFRRKGFEEKDQPSHEFPARLPKMPQGIFVGFNPFLQKLQNLLG